MKLGGMVDLGARLVVNFGPGGSPLGQKVKNFGNAYAVDRLRD